MSTPLNLFKTKPKAISFDWDGTLAITHDLLVEAINYVLKKYNLPDYSVVRNNKDKNKSFKENFPLFFGSDYKKAYEEYLSYYNDNCVNRVILFDKADEFVNIAVNSQIDVFIVSNKEKSILLKEVDKCFKKNPFKSILGNGDTKSNKPSSEPLLKIFKTENNYVNEKSFWHIGDGSPDFLSAKEANVLPIIINNDAFIEPCLKFKNFEELIKTIEW